MKTIKRLTVKPDKVTLVVEDREGWNGRVRSTTQVTFSRREFERALQAAEITVPWKDVVR